jgi:hypothetical protein
MIPKVIRDRLVEALLKVPGVDEKAGRDTLLIGVECEASTRHANSPRIDVQMIIARLENAVRLEDDRWYLLELLDNARRRTPRTELDRELKGIRNALEEMWVETRKKQLNPAFLAQPCLFDLREPVGKCLVSLPPDPGLCGFVLPTQTHRLLQHFCDKLSHRAVEMEVWTRNEVFTAHRYIIDVPHTSVQDAFTHANKHKGHLTDQNVVWAVFMQDISDARDLWHRLGKEFGRKLAKHFIVVFGLPPGVLKRTKPPKTMLILPAPRCTARDVADWVGPIVKSLKWQEVTLADRWSRVIIASNIESQEGLPIERLFDQLEYHRNQLTQHPTEEAFAKRLAELEQIGD